MHKERETCAYKNYAAGRVRGYIVEVDGKVRLGLLDEEQATKMKEDFSCKMDSFIQKWSEAGDKWVKEMLAELGSKAAEPEEDFEVSEKPKDVEPIKSSQESEKMKIIFNHGKDKTDTPFSSS
jgi:hypothetical protein